MCYKSINSPFKEPLIFFTFSLTVNTISFIPGEPIIICLKREPRKILTLFNTVDLSKFTEFAEIFIIRGDINLRRIKVEN